MEEAPPDVDTLVVGEARVVDDHLVAEHLLEATGVAEHLLEATGELSGKCYLRHKHECLTPLMQHKVDQVHVDLGFAA